MIKIFRTSTVALSLDLLLKGQLKFLNQYYDVVAVAGEDNHLRNVRQREKVRTIGVSMERDISIGRDLVSLVRLYLVFTRERPDMVHSITPKAGLLSMIAAWLAGVPVRAHTFTGLIFPTATGRKRKLLVAMDKLLCLLATHIYPEGEGVRRDLIENKITKKPLNIIANGNVNGIDTNYFHPLSVAPETSEALRTELKLTNEIVFIFVGRLVADKGICELVQAFVSLSQTNPNIRLLVVGPREKGSELPSETEELLSNHAQISTFGYQSDIRPYLAISDVLVLPSYREGFPNVVLQGGAMGLPAVVTNVNGSNEIIENQLNGLVVPVADSVALQDAMHALCQNADERKKMGAAARQKTVERYDQQIVWNALLLEYQRVIFNRDV